VATYEKIKKWIRTPECDANLAKLIVGGYTLYPSDFESCAGPSYINVDDVGVYYWPDPHPDTSCRSIVSNGTLSYGATIRVYTDQAFLLGLLPR